MPEKLTSEEIKERRDILATHNYISEMEGIKVTEAMKADMELYITGKMTADEYEEYIIDKLGLNKNG